jgi:hypothetical protein
MAYRKAPRSRELWHGAKPLKVGLELTRRNVAITGTS